MTHALSNTTPHPGVDLAKTSVASHAAWQHPGPLQALTGWSWNLGIAATCLTIGVIGLFAPDLPPIHLKTLEGEQAAELAMIETSMAELQSLGTEDSPPPESVTPSADLPEWVPPPVESLEVPEIAEAMTMEDIFAIPAAPRIEDALKPVDPVVKPKPQVESRPRTPPAPRSTGSNVASSSSGGSAGGLGAGGGTGRGKFPAPPYPGFARSGGMQGTVRLAISVGPSGLVEGVSVISSTGYTALDSYASSWVRRNWRWPGGTANRYTLPLTFKLR